MKMLKDYYDERKLTNKFNEAIEKNYNVALKMGEEEMIDHYDIIMKYIIDNGLELVDIIGDVETVEILYYGFVVAHVTKRIKSGNIPRWKPLHAYKGRFDEFYYFPEKAYKLAKFLFSIKFPIVSLKICLNFSET